MAFHQLLSIFDLEELLGSSNQVLPLPIASHYSNAHLRASNASHANSPNSSYKMLMFALLSG
jgi:hypothetical protein